ncbi:MAG: transcriptional regulator, partial [Limosilactobacillus fermentum]|nr:transcriptional regulator [Limosilactobacillus fermentum]
MMMKYSHRVSDGVHVLSYVYLHQDTKISSARLASSIDSNPSLVRRLMS